MTDRPHLPVIPAPVYREIWEVTFYDADADDNRGVTRSMGAFHHLANAEKYANDANAEILKRHNDNAQNKWRIAVTQAAEFNALVAAGLRDGDVRPVPSKPKIWTERPSDYSDWWEVRLYDYDWMDEP